MRHLEMLKECGTTRQWKCWIYWHFSIENKEADWSKYMKFKKTWGPNCESSFLQSNARVKRGSFQKLIFEKIRVEVRKQSIMAAAVKDWNSLLSLVVESPALEAYKSNIVKLWRKSLTSAESHDVDGQTCKHFPETKIIDMTWLKLTWLDLFASIAQNGFLRVTLTLKW